MGYQVVTYTLRRCGNASVLEGRLWVGYHILHYRGLTLFVTERLICLKVTFRLESEGKPARGSEEWQRNLPCSCCLHVQRWQGKERGCFRKAVALSQNEVWVIRSQDFSLVNPHGTLSIPQHPTPIRAVIHLMSSNIKSGVPGFQIILMFQTMFFCVI